MKITAVLAVPMILCAGSTAQKNNATFDHLAIYVRDLEASKRFYSELFHFDYAIKKTSLEQLPEHDFCSICKHDFTRSLYLRLNHQPNERVIANRFRMVFPV